MYKYIKKNYNQLFKLNLKKFQVYIKNYNFQ